jgi:hypothetical protein
MLGTPYCLRAAVSIDIDLAAACLTGMLVIRIIPQQPRFLATTGRDEQS